jgi:hypothetical protein
LNEGHIDIFDQDARNIATLLALLNPTANFSVILCCVEQEPTLSTLSRGIKYEPVIHILLNDVGILANGILEVQIPVHVHTGELILHVTPIITPTSTATVDSLPYDMCFSGHHISTLDGVVATLGCLLYGNDNVTYGLTCGHLIMDKVKEPFLLRPLDFNSLDEHACVIFPPHSTILDELQLLETNIDGYNSVLNQLHISKPSPKSDTNKNQIAVKLKNLQAKYHKLEICSKVHKTDLIVGRVYASELGCLLSDSHLSGCGIPSSQSLPQGLKAASPSSTSLPDVQVLDPVVSDWSLLKMEGSRVGSNPSTWIQFGALSPGMEVMMPTLDKHRWGTVNGKQMYRYNGTASREWAIFCRDRNVTMAQPGDSGAVLITKDRKKVVGLVFGGCGVQGYTVASSMRNVVDRAEAVTGIQFHLQPLT